MNINSEILSFPWLNKLGEKLYDLEKKQKEVSTMLEALEEELDRYHLEEGEVIYSAEENAAFVVTPIRIGGIEGEEDCLYLGVMRRRISLLTIDETKETENQT